MSPKTHRRAWNRAESLKPRAGGTEGGTEPNLRVVSRHLVSHDKGGSFLMEPCLMSPKTHRRAWNRAESLKPRTGGTEGGIEPNLRVVQPSHCRLQLSGARRLWGSNDGLVHLQTHRRLEVVWILSAQELTHDRLCCLCRSSIWTRSHVRRQNTTKQLCSISPSVARRVVVGTIEWISPDLRFDCDS